MGHPRKPGAKAAHFGATYPVELLTAFGRLCMSNGVSMVEAMRRCMINAINLGQIPGIERMDLMRREREKFGEAVPTYEGEEPLPSTPAARQTKPAARAE